MASDEPQEFVCTKSPLTPMLPMLNAAVPVLLSVIVWVALVVPTNWSAKFKLAVESEITAATPLPARATVRGLLLSA